MRELDARERLGHKLVDDEICKRIREESLAGRLVVHGRRAGDRFGGSRECEGTRDVRDSRRREAQPVVGLLAGFSGRAADGGLRGWQAAPTPAPYPKGVLVAGRARRPGYGPGSRLACGTLPARDRRRPPRDADHRRCTRPVARLWLLPVGPGAGLVTGGKGFVVGAGAGLVAGGGSGLAGEGTGAGAVDDPKTRVVDGPGVAGWDPGIGVVGHGPGSHTVGSVWVTV